MKARYTRIYVPEQYGLNYKIEQDDNAPELSLALDSPEGLPKTFFLKTPDDEADKVATKDFSNEFASRESINSAAHHLAQTQDPTAAFKICKMLGKGTFRLPESGKDIECLIYEYGHGEMLDKLFGQEVSKTDLSTEVLHFAQSLARAVQVLHNQGVVHSFLVPRNILCEIPPPASIGNTLRFDFKGQFNLVGFGYARLCDAQGKLPRGFDERSGDVWFRAPETRERDTFAAYWFPADIYSVGALLYYILLRKGGISDDAARKSLQFPKDVRRLKAHIAAALGSAVPETVRVNENILKIVDSCVRTDQDQRFSCVEELMEALDIAQTAGGHSGGVQPTQTPTGSVGRENPTQPQSESEFENLVARVRLKTDDTPEDKKVPQPKYFDNIRRTLAKEVVQKYRSLTRGHLEVYGSRDRIVQSLCRLLASAGDGDVYATVTLPGYWTDGNLGSNGRFLTMNKHMVRNGVNIHRVFLVTKDRFHELPEQEQLILEAQLAAVKAIENEKGTFEKAGVECTYGEFTVNVRPVTEPTIAEFENVGSTVAYLGKPTGGGFVDPEQTVFLNFFSTARAQWSKGGVLVTRSIKKVRYWVKTDEAKERFEAKLREFRKNISDGTSVENYVRGDFLGELKDITIESALRSAPGSGGAAISFPLR